jgi:hypothetical protein
MKFLLVYVVFFAACSKQIPEPVYPEKLPIKEQAAELSKLPEYQAPTVGEVVDLSKDEAAPFDGLLLDETKAFAVDDLRTSYDEVYRLSEVNRRYLLSVIEIQEQELYRADNIIDQKEAALKKIRDSWWARHKLSVGIVAGVLVGASFAIGAGAVWAKVDGE